MRTRNRFAWAVLLLAGLLVGCASQGAGNRSDRSSRTTLSATEIERSGYADLYTVIQTLRPSWLRVQGATSFSGQEQIQVYLDGYRFGGVESLRQIPTRSISSAEFLSGLEATQRWGLNHGMGAIVVSTR